MDVKPEAPLILGCGALAIELRAVLAASGLGQLVEVDFLPAPLHNRPDQIVAAVDARLATEPVSRRVILAYADCGTGGGLDRYIASCSRPIVRLPGEHCYSFFAGREIFDRLHEQEMGSFYLTDFLAKNFDQLVWRSLRLDEFPNLRRQLFAHYRRVVFLDQSSVASTLVAARRAASALELDFVHVEVGLGPFQTAVDESLEAVLGGSTSTRPSVAPENEQESPQPVHIQTVSSEKLGGTKKRPKVD